MHMRAETARNRHIAAAIAVLAAMLPVAVAAIVLGIIGMHALDTHGVMSDADHTTMTMATVSEVGTGVATFSEPNATTPVTSVAPLGNSGHDMGHMVVLRVAMIAAAAGALLLLLRYLARVWFHLPANRVALSKRLTTRLATGPPPVWEFSVVRC